jgi:hypothetical protein
VTKELKRSDVNQIDRVKVLLKLEKSVVRKQTLQVNPLKSSCLIYNVCFLQHHFSGPNQETLMI